MAARVEQDAPRLAGLLVRQRRTDPAWIDARGIPSRGREFLASMGIYLFDRDTIGRLLAGVLRQAELRVGAVVLVVGPAEGQAEKLRQVHEPVGGEVGRAPPPRRGTAG